MLRMQKSKPIYDFSGDMTMKIKILSLLVTFIMIATMIPFTAFTTSAAEGNEENSVSIFEATRTDFRD